MFICDKSVIVSMSFAREKIKYYICVEEIANGDGANIGVNWSIFKKMPMRI